MWIEQVLNGQGYLALAQIAKAIQLKSVQLSSIQSNESTESTEIIRAPSCPSEDNFDTAKIQFEKALNVLTGDHNWDVRSPCCPSLCETPCTCVGVPCDAFSGTYAYM